MKQAKPLTGEQYMRQFSRSARWQLGAVEAAETIGDYREMVFQKERDPAKLVEELGDPIQAAWLLTDARTYRQWVKLFAVLTAGLLMCAWWVWTARYWIHIYRWDDGFFGPAWRGAAVMAVGLVLSLVWFRRNGQKSGVVSRRLLLALAAVLAFAVVTVAVVWYVCDPKFLDYYAAVSEAGNGVPVQVRLLRKLLMWGGVACAPVALAGLVLARCYDRRWLALYTLALTVLTMFVFVMFTFCSMDLTFARASQIQQYLFPQLISLAAVGLIGTGVALC